MNIATESVFSLESKFMKVEREISVQQTAEIKKKYDEIIEQVLDDVFDAESLLSKENFKTNLEKDNKWIVDPEGIRFKLKIYN